MGMSKASQPACDCAQCCNGEDLSKDGRSRKVSKPAPEDQQGRICQPRESVEEPRHPCAALHQSERYHKPDQTPRDFMQIRIKPPNHTTHCEIAEKNDERDHVSPAQCPP